MSGSPECCNPLCVFRVHWTVLKLGQYLFLSCPSPTCQNIHTSQTCRLNKGQPVQMTKHIPQSFPTDIFSTLMTRASSRGIILNPGTTPDHFALLLFPDKVGADWHFRKQNSANMNLVTCAILEASYHQGYWKMPVLYTVRLWCVGLFNIRLGLGFWVGFRSGLGT